jgi:hypothetical protein
MSIYSNIKNNIVSLVTKKPVVAQPSNQRSAMYSITRVQFERKRFDMAMWRDACKEAEDPWYPMRVKMQRMFLDTVLNEHLKACIRRKKNLTLLRKFKLCDEAGNIDEAATNMLKASWFRLFQSYALDAQLFGYNLIHLGDLVNGKFPDLHFVKRQNVSPDTKVIKRFEYAPSGQSFTEAPLSDWLIYVSTPGETGSSPCGYGLLYEIAKTEIMLRNNMGQNADYNEVFGQPIRKGTTNKVDTERAEFERALQSMGSNAYILLEDGRDTLELVEAGSRGSAYLTFENFEQRGEKKISKVILGHAEALDSVEGQLGSSSGEDNPVVKALLGVQSEDAEFLQPIINDELLPRLRNLGFAIGEHLKFQYINDEEKEMFRQREDESNKRTADMIKTFKDAGADITDETWEWVEERTGIPGMKKAEPPPPPPTGINDQKADVLTKQVEKMTPQEKIKMNGKAKLIK